MRKLINKFAALAAISVLSACGGGGGGGDSAESAPSIEFRTIVTTPLTSTCKSPGESAHVLTFLRPLSFKT